MQNEQPWEEENDPNQHKTQRIKFRTKRAIFGFWGTYVMNPLFGLMDEEQAEEITQKMNQLIEQNGEQNLIIENNMSIIKQTLGITNRTFESYKSNIQKLDKYINELTKDISDVEKEIKNHINFEYISSTAILLSSEHERYIELIKNALKNTLYGDFTEFISLDQLKKDLKEVANTLDDTPYMILNRLRDIQQVASIRGTIMNKRLLLELDIPMINKNQFKLHKIIPLPIRSADQVIIMNLKENTFLVDNHTRTYIPVKLQDLTSCKNIFDNSLLSPIRNVFRK